MSKIDPALINSDAWVVVEETDTYRRSMLRIDERHSIMRTEFLADERLVEENRQMFNDSYGQRFGDGKVVARIPLNKFYRDVQPYLKEGDRDFLPWYLDRDENRPFRTFRGTIRKR